MEIFLFKLKKALSDKECSYLARIQAMDKKNVNFKKANTQISLISKALLFFVLSKKVPSDSLKFDKNKFGKPFLKNTPNIHFNLSHSKNYIVLAVSELSSLGIDIEKIRPINFNLVKRFFSKDEVTLFENIPIEQKLSYFFDLWTLKESYVKFKGVGFSHMPFNSFSIIKQNNNIYIKSDPPPINTCHFMQYYIDNYIISVCSEDFSFPYRIITIEIEEILEYIFLHHIFTD